MEIAISFGAFIFLVWNISIFLKASSTVAQADKKKACLLAILALIISIMPWIKVDHPSSSLSHYDIIKKSSQK